MCKYCGKKGCALTKEMVLEHGPILESNAYSAMQGETSDTPQTYAFEGVPAYNSLSALIPDEDEEDPHAYIRFVFDEDTGCEGGWESSEMQDPLKWQTEKEFLEKLESGRV